MYREITHLRLSRYTCALRLLFIILFVIGLFSPDTWLSDQGYDDYCQDLYEPLLYSTPLDPVKHAPLCMFHLKQNAIRNALSFLNSTKNIVDIVTNDKCTKISMDFFEPLNLIRVPGPNVQEYINNSDCFSKSTEEERSTQTPSGTKEILASDVAEKVRLPRNLIQSAATLKPEDMASMIKGGRMDVDYNELMSINNTVLKRKFRRFDLPRIRASALPRHGWRKFYIAINLYKNEDILPFFADALVAFIEDELAPFFSVSSSVVVSIYSNAGGDLTAPLIRSYLIPRLQKAGVETIYATTSGRCMGYPNRQFFHSRIEWLSCVRNKALEPLYRYGIHVFPSTDRHNEAPKNCQYGHNSSNANECRQKNDIKADEASHGQEDSEDMVVLFFNDILFRPRDITILLESVVEPEMARLTLPDGFLSLAKNATDEKRSSELPLLVYPRPTQMADPSRVTQAELDEVYAHQQNTTFDVACAIDYNPLFYDIWVSRTWLGQAFSSSIPFTQEKVTLRSLRRIFRLRSSSVKSTNNNGYTNTGRNRKSSDQSDELRRFSLPVKSCWNGVAAIRGSLFLQHTSLPHVQPLEFEENATDVANYAPPQPSPTEDGTYDHATPSNSTPTSYLSQDADEPCCSRTDTICSPDLISSGHGSLARPPNLTVVTQDRTHTQTQMLRYNLLCSPSQLASSHAMPAVVQRESGALYDRVDASVVRADLERIYTHMVMNRLVDLQNIRRSVDSTINSIGSLTRTTDDLDAALTFTEASARPDLLKSLTYRKLYQSSQFEWLNVTSWCYPGKTGVNELGKDMSLPTPCDVSVTTNKSCITCENDNNRHTPYNRPTSPDYARTNSLIGANSDASSIGSGITSFRDDSTYYRARHPSLRFRHRHLPSYGATAHGIATVSGVGCDSSECTLICEDVAHAVILRYRRTPIILMNVNVRVWYKPSLYDSILHAKILTSRIAFEVSIPIERMIRWARKVWLHISLQGTMTNDAKRSEYAIDETAQTKSSPRRWNTPKNLTDITGTMHDWTLNRPALVYNILMYDVNTSTWREAVVNITQLTYKSCIFHTGNIINIHYIIVRGFCLLSCICLLNYLLPNRYKARILQLNELNVKKLRLALKPHRN